jgi:hypothetical protein
MCVQTSGFVGEAVIDFFAAMFSLTRRSIGWVLTGHRFCAI